MTPSFTHQNTASLVPKDSIGRHAFWLAYEIALDDARHHNIDELLAMAKFEREQAYLDLAKEYLKRPEGI